MLFLGKTGVVKQGQINKKKHIFTKICQKVHFNSHEGVS